MSYFKYFLILPFLYAGMIFAQSPVDPDDASDGVAVTTTAVSWTAFGSGDYDFEMWVDDVQGSGSVFVATVIGISDETYTIPALSENKIYYWYVRDNSGPGAWNEYSFTTELGDLLTPGDGVTGISILPEFTWDVSAATPSNMFLIIDDNSGFTGPIYSESVTGSGHSTAETETGMPLDNGTTYYWKITGEVGGNTFHSLTQSFTTYPAFNLSLSWPTDEAENVAQPIFFNWFTQTSINNMKFDLQIRQQSSTPSAADWADINTIEYTDLTVTTYQVSGLLGGETYFWRVIAKNTAGEVIRYSSAYEFSTEGGSAIVITQSWPISWSVSSPSVVTTLTPDAHWYTDRYPEDLTFQITYSTSSTTVDDPAETGAFVTPIGTVPASPTGDLTYPFPTLDANTTYYWKVVGTYTPPVGPGATIYSPTVAWFNTPNSGNGIPVVPIIAYPIDDVELYTTSPYIYWYVTSDGQGLVYDIEIREYVAGPSPNGLTDVPNISDVSGYFHQVTSVTLEPGKKYIWQVRSDNGTTTSAWSDPETFTITGGITNAYPVALWPANNPTMYVRSPLLSWYMYGSTLGLTKYTVKWIKSSSDPGNDAWWTAFNPLSNDEDEGQTDVTSLTTLFHQIEEELTYGEKYYWAVAAYNGSDYTDWSEESFTITSGGPSSLTVYASSPAGGATIGSTTADLYWYVVGNTDGITSYEVEYSTSSLFPGGSTTSTSVSHPSTTYQASGLTPGATYYWRVYATDGVTNSSWSSTESFIVAPGSAAIQPIVGGPNNVVVNTSSPTLSWLINTEFNSALNYELEISENQEFTNAELITGLEEMKTQVSGLEADKTYFWRVRSRLAGSSGDNAFSLFSSAGTFRVGDGVTSVINPNIPADFTVEQNYPNPFNPETAISFALPENGLVKINIFNVLGQKIKTLVNSELNAGSYRLNWKGDDDSGMKVTSGTYIYRVTFGNNTISKKMLLIK